MLTFSKHIPTPNQVYEALGGSLVVNSSLEKQAEDPQLEYNLVGTLYKSSSGWIMLSVPNALALGVFKAMSEPGISLPGDAANPFNAHISVIRPEELAQIGEPEISERGKPFRYTIGRFYSVVPAGWPNVEKVWFLKVHSPELQALRKSYGLTPFPKNNEYDFHITCAIRKRGVLGRSETSKV